jgi:hypothetical protein
MSTFPNDPANRPIEPDLGRLGAPGSSGLGSLSQSARRKHLGQARGVLIAVGVLTLLVNGIFFFLAEGMVHDQIQKQVRAAGPQMAFDQAKLRELEESAVRETKLVSGATMALGAVFIVLGLAVKQYPVPATALGLILYIGAAVIFGLMDPTTLYQGIIIKVIFVVALVKALQAAIAYQKESQAAAAGEYAA